MTSLNILYLFYNLLPIKLTCNQSNLKEISSFIFKLEKSMRNIAKIKIALWIYYKLINGKNYVNEILSIKI